MFNVYPSGTNRLHALRPRHSHHNLLNSDALFVYFCGPAVRALFTKQRQLCSSGGCTASNTSTIQARGRSNGHKTPMSPPWSTRESFLFALHSKDASLATPTTALCISLALDRSRASQSPHPENHLSITLTTSILATARCGQGPSLLPMDNSHPHYRLGAKRKRMEEVDNGVEKVPRVSSVEPRQSRPLVQLQFAQNSPIVDLTCGFGPSLAVVDTSSVEQTGAPSHHAGTSPVLDLLPAELNAAQQKPSPPECLTQLELNLIIPQSGDAGIKGLPPQSDPTDNTKGIVLSAEEPPIVCFGMVCTPDKLTSRSLLTPKLPPRLQTSSGVAMLAQISAAASTSAS